MYDFYDFYTITDWAIKVSEYYSGKFYAEANRADMSIEVFLKSNNEFVASFAMMEDVGWMRVAR